MINPKKTHRAKSLSLIDGNVIYMKIFDEKLVNESTIDYKDICSVKNLDDFKDKMLKLGIEVKESDLKIMKSILESDDSEEMKSKFKDLGLGLSDEDIERVLSGLNMGKGSELSDEKLSKIDGGVGLVTLGVAILAAGSIILGACGYILRKGFKKDKK